MKEVIKVTEENVRLLWQNEQQDFTPWLKENIHTLSDALGIEIIEARGEVAIGDFQVDILAEEKNTERVVVIENQLYPSDHQHLGQLLTYAAGFEGAIVVWISSELRPEHERSLSWLNSISSEDVAFFGVRIEVLRVGGSKPGFRFNVIVQPDEWEPKRKTASERMEKYKRFYDKLLLDLRERGHTTAEKGNPDTYQAIGGAGVSNAFYEFRFAQGGKFRVALYMQTPNQQSKEDTFDFLYSKKSDIESRFGGELEWERRDEQKHSVIAIYRNGSIDNENLDDIRTWAVERLENLKNALQPYEPIN